MRIVIMGCVIEDNLGRPEFGNVRNDRPAFGFKPRFILR
jgi:hypothetical protein